MPHFEFVYQDDGSERIKFVLKDGQPTTKTVRLEMPNAIVQTYFKASFANLRKMTTNDDDREGNREFGLQSFLMSLTGLEAFSNVFFHLAGMERNLPDVVKACRTGEQTVEHKIKNLATACYGKSIADGKMINRKVRELYDLRSAIVHPKWEPVSLDMGGVAFAGMSDNFQQLFEDREYVREALRWCLLVVARVGLLAGSETGSGFVMRWTSLTDSNETLSEQLGINPNGKVSA